MLCSTSDCKFTLLPFTSASGEAVCCVVIFQQSEGQVPEIWLKGIDQQVLPVTRADGSVDISASEGSGKFYPYGPTCEFKYVLCI